MCDPVTAATALAIASASAGVVGEYQTAQATTRAVNRQSRAQAEEASARSSQEAGERVRAARRAAARARVGAGEAGVSGQSFEAQIANELGAANQDLAIVQKQGGFTERAINANALNQTARFRGLNPVSSALKIASAGASGYSTGLQIQASS